MHQATFVGDSLSQNNLFSLEEIQACPRRLGSSLRAKYEHAGASQCTPSEQKSLVVLSSKMHRSQYRGNQPCPWKNPNLDRKTVLTTKVQLPLNRTSTELFDGAHANGPL